MELINLTPHEINIIGKEQIITIEPSGKIARCEVDTQKKEILKYNNINIPISQMTYKEATDLPKEEAGVYYIVSYVVASQYLNRRDLLIPTDFARNEKGQIIGCYSLARVS